MKVVRNVRLTSALAMLAIAALLGGAADGLFGVCGPFTDVSDAAFCPFVLEVFYLGITTGTTPTTYDPSASVSRLQMAAFLSRSVDTTLRRAGRRAALAQFWTPQTEDALGLTTAGGTSHAIRSDGTDLWLADSAGGGLVHRFRGSDGRLLETWTGASSAHAVLVAMGRVFVTSLAAPGRLYRLDPGLPAGAVTAVATNLGTGPRGITFDGTRIWTANLGGSLSLITPAASPPWPVTTVSSGFMSPFAALYNGSNVWVTDEPAGKLLKLDGTGAILQTVTVGSLPQILTFDGTNLWVPNFSSDTVSVVRASTGAVLSTLTGNGLSDPTEASFDGQRILVTSPSGDRVSLWKAADLTPLGFVSTGDGTNPTFACSDGLNFWVVLFSVDRLARF